MINTISRVVFSVIAIVPWGLLIKGSNEGAWTLTLWQLVGLGVVVILMELKEIKDMMGGTK